MKTNPFACKSVEVWRAGARIAIATQLGTVVFQLPAQHQKRMRTTNLLERQNKEIKRRTRVATLFPNEASLLRLVSAVLAELSDEWETGKRYVNTNA